ncbi:hypothetical protein ACR79T_12500 [Sphingobacterium spiritivorum]|uniref:hypothetical protein n=1 Tax=Sphingobacterium spiritivorum TaxID=258 RepID=UPI003DA4D0B0
MEKLKKYILGSLSCDFGVNGVKTANSVKDLISLLKSPQGIEFCMANSFPSLDILTAYESELLASGVFLRGKYSLENPNLVIAFGGTIGIHLDGYTVCQVYATNDAQINVFGNDSSIAMVEVHGDADVFVQQLDESSINVFQKS